MNVIGYDASGEITELQIRNQNESFVAISKRFRHALEIGASVEADETLTQIINEIKEGKQSDYEKLLLFQCERELSKIRMKMGMFRDAIPLLISTLKVDESRVDIWVELSQCAKETQNTDLFRASMTKIQQIRPEFLCSLPRPSLPPLSIEKHE